MTQPAVNSDEEIAGQKANLKAGLGLTVHEKYRSFVNLHQKTPSTGRVFLVLAAHPSAGMIRIRLFGSDCASLSALWLPVLMQ